MPIKNNLDPVDFSCGDVLLASQEILFILKSSIIINRYYKISVSVYTKQYVGKFKD